MTVFPTLERAEKRSGREAWREAEGGRGEVRAVCRARDLHTQALNRVASEGKALSMRPVRVLLADEMIRAVEREARRRRLPRSTLVRVALARFLGRGRNAALEHIRGYQKLPQSKQQVTAWERVQVWPDE